jgi:hypothetical protein
MFAKYLTLIEFRLRMCAELIKGLSLLYFSRTVYTLMLLSVMLMVGCGTTESMGTQKRPPAPAAEGELANNSVDSESQLKERIEGRWAALIKRDFTAAYKYQSPGYRELYSVEQFRGVYGSQVGWLSARIAKLTIKDASAEAVVSVQYHAMVPFNPDSGSSVTKGETALDEKWIQDGGVWYHVQR